MVSSKTLLWIWKNKNDTQGRKPDLPVSEGVTDLTQDLCTLDFYEKSPTTALPAGGSIRTHAATGIFTFNLDNMRLKTPVYGVL